MKPTIKQMFKEIFFDATTGRRSADNYLDGMTAIDHIAAFYYRSYFERVYREWKSGQRESRVIIEDIYHDLRQRGRFHGLSREVADAISNVLYA